MTQSSLSKAPRVHDATAKPSTKATRLFTRLVIGFAILYGLWAVVLSFRIVVQQQAVRRHLDFALQECPRRTFPTHAAALTLARDFVAQLNTDFPTNPCTAGPAFTVAQGDHVLAQDCQVVIVAAHRRLRVRGYDTQGHRMDNIFERLNPPPRHL